MTIEPNKPVKKTWKDHLLASGLPLEHSVRSVLKQHDILAGEYHYERNDEWGKAKVFSIDLHGHHRDEHKQLHVELFIECKYRHDSVKWVFAPEEYTLWFENDFVILDQMVPGGPLKGIPDPEDPYHGRPFLSEDCLCRMGVEIIGNNSDRSGIREGLQQLRYALIDFAAAGVSDQVQSFEFPDLVKPTVLVPLLVTTAELWRMSSSSTLEDVRAAGSIESVAARHEILLCMQEPNSQEHQHAHSRISQVLPKLDKVRKQRICEAARRKEGWYDNFADCYSFQPSFFLIVEYSFLKDHLERLLRFFDDIAELRRLSA